MDVIPAQPAEAVSTPYDHLYPRGGYAGAWRAKRDLYRSAGILDALYPMTPEQMRGLAHGELSFMAPAGYDVVSFSCVGLRLEECGALVVEADGSLSCAPGSCMAFDMDGVGPIMKVVCRDGAGRIGVWYLDIPDHIYVDCACV